MQTGACTSVCIHSSYLLTRVAPFIRSLGPVTHPEASAGVSRDSPFGYSLSRPLPSDNIRLQRALTPCKTLARCIHHALVGVERNIWDRRDRMTQLLVEDMNPIHPIHEFSTLAPVYGQWSMLIFRWWPISASTAHKFGAYRSTTVTPCEKHCSIMVRTSSTLPING